MNGNENNTRVIHTPFGAGEKTGGDRDALRSVRRSKAQGVFFFFWSMTTSTPILSLKNVREIIIVFTVRIIYFDFHLLIAAVSLKRNGIDLILNGFLTSVDKGGAPRTVPATKAEKNALYLPPLGDIYLRPRQRRFVSRGL